jgi:DNA-binding transcriptional LysR family regulator
MPLRYTLRQLEYFVAVGETGSIAMAAERVNVSAPSISAAIAQLEAELGLPLFVRRHAQGLSPTQAGRRLMAQAQLVLTEAATLADQARAITGKVAGPLAVGCLLSFAQIVLPDLRRRFLDRFPDVQFRQYERDQAEIFEGLRTAALDVALTYDMQIPADLVFHPLVGLPPYAIVAETHPLAHLDSVSPDRLAEHPMILLDLPISAEYFLSFFDRARARPKIAERTRDLTVMCSLVANGFGYGLANIRQISDRAPDGKKLRFLPLTGPVRPMQLGLAHAPGADAALTVRAFIDHCRDTARTEGVPGLNLAQQADATPERTA